MDEDIIVTLKRSNDLLMTFGNDYSDVFLPAIDEIERLRDCEAYNARSVVWGNDEIERLREALRTICDGPRDVEKSYAELFAQVKIEARAALKEKE